MPVTRECPANAYVCHQSKSRQKGKGGSHLAAFCSRLGSNAHKLAGLIPHRHAGTLGPAVQAPPPGSSIPLGCELLGRPEMSWWWMTGHIIMPPGFGLCPTRSF